MTTTTLSFFSKIKNWLFGWIVSFRDNPVMVKELRGRTRGARMTIVLSLYLLLLGGLISLSIGSFQVGSSTGFNVSLMQVTGKTIFGITVVVQFLVASLIAPALTAGSISSEREHQTYDILRTTLLSARALVAGKLFSALFFILLLFLAAFPLLSLAFLFGGITLEEIIIAYVMLFVTALTFCSIGLFFSSFQRRTLVANVLSYTTTLFIIAGIPLLLFIGQLALPLIVDVFTNPSNPTGYIWVVVIGWLATALNPLMAGAASEALLIGDQAIWFTSLPISSTRTITVISPWLGYVIFYTLLSLYLLKLSTKFVSRPEK
jgi:ABC-type transport system involved in multi-copper enzyme maturation permease subunit